MQQIEDNDFMIYQKKGKKEAARKSLKKNQSFIVPSKKSSYKKLRSKPNVESR